MKQKQDESGADRQKHGAAGGDTDSIRNAILEEAVIVCKFNFILKVKSNILWFHCNFYVGRSAPHSVSVVQHFLVN